MSTLTDTFSDIADAIRAKTGSSATMTPAQMPGAIASISRGSKTSNIYVGLYIKEIITSSTYEEV